MLTNAHTRELLTVKEVATRLGLHPMTVRRKIREGELRAVRLGGKGSSVRVDAAELERWVYHDPTEGGWSTMPRSTQTPRQPVPRKSRHIGGAGPTV